MLDRAVSKAAALERNGWGWRAGRKHEKKRTQWQSVLRVDDSFDLASMHIVKTLTKPNVKKKRQRFVCTIKNNFIET
jgi:hypothetical protein